MKQLKTISFIVFLLTNIFLSAQQNTSAVAVPKLPVPQVQNPIVNTQIVPNSSLPNQNPHTPFDQRRQHQLIMEEVRQYEQYRQEAEKQQYIDQLLTQGFPSMSAMQGTQSFYDAYNEINSMLKGETSLDLARTVFLVENAFYNNTMNYSDFKKAIKERIDFCNQKITEEKLDPNNNLVKNMMLFRLVCDTLEITPRGSERPLTSYPIKYDYEDYKSEQHYDSHFVTKLMRTGEGQCHSMPLYYLVLAEEIGAEAYWAFSPRHSFVKIQDERGEIGRAHV